MTKLKINIILIWVCLIQTYRSQVVCADVSLEPNSGIQQEFIFSNFRQYNSGIVYHGVAKIKIDVEDQIPANPSCKWKLSVEVDNSPGSGTPNDEWETVTTYGGTKTPPTIDILEFRVTNACATSPINGVFNNFSLHGDEIEIIEDTGVQQAAGSCATNTNGPGTFLSNYDEFVFEFDLRIQPGVGYDPGYYVLQLFFL